MAKKIEKTPPSLLDVETERTDPVALDGLGVPEGGEHAILDTAGRQVVTEIVGEDGEIDAAAMGHVSE